MLTLQANSVKTLNVLASLKQLALKYLCIPATPAASEKSFTSAGLINTKL